MCLDYHNEVKIALKGVFSKPSGKYIVGPDFTFDIKFGDRLYYKKKEESLAST